MRTNVKTCMQSPSFNKDRPLPEPFNRIDLFWAKSKGGGESIVETAVSKYNEIQAAGGNAFGLDRVPYDNYLTYLHEGERVLTASQAREMDRGGMPPINITVSGNTFGAGLDEAAVAEAIADTAVRKILAGFQG